MSWFSKITSGIFSAPSRMLKRVVDYFYPEKREESYIPKTFEAKTKLFSTKDFTRRQHGESGVRLVNPDSYDEEKISQIVSTRNLTPLIGLYNDINKDELGKDREIKIKAGMIAKRIFELNRSSINKYIFVVDGITIFKRVKTITPEGNAVDEYKEMYVREKFYRSYSDFNKMVSFLEKVIESIVFEDHDYGGGTTFASIMRSVKLVNRTDYFNHMERVVEKKINNIRVEIALKGQSAKLRKDLTALNRRLASIQEELLKSQRTGAFFPYMITEEDIKKYKLDYPIESYNRLDVCYPGEESKINQPCFIKCLVDLGLFKHGSKEHINALRKSTCLSLKTSDVREIIRSIGKTIYRVDISKDGTSFKIMKITPDDEAMTAVHLKDIVVDDTFVFPTIVNFCNHYGVLRCKDDFNLAKALTVASPNLQEIEIPAVSTPLIDEHDLFVDQSKRIPTFTELETIDEEVVTEKVAACGCKYEVKDVKIDIERNKYHLLYRQAKVTVWKTKKITCKHPLGGSPMSGGIYLNIHCDADTETDTSNPLGHQMIAFGFKVGDLPAKSYISTDLQEFKNYISEDIKAYSDRVLEYHNLKEANVTTKAICWFHNCGYDIRVLANGGAVYNSPVMAGSTIYSISMNINGMFQLQIRDFYKIIGRSLGTIPRIFGLKACKMECIEYSYYTTNNTLDYLDDRGKASNWINLDQYTKNENKIKRLREQGDDVYRVIEGVEKVQPFILLKKYQRSDVLIQSHCRNRARQLFHDVMTECGSKISGFDITKVPWLEDVMTIAGLAWKFAEQTIDDIDSLSGRYADLVRMAAKGGRVAVNEEHKRKEISGISMQDFDAVNLYPSSMCRILEEFGGFPIGKPHVTKDLNRIGKSSYYIVVCRALNIGKKQQIPFYSENDAAGILNYTNECNPEYLHVWDKITLEDMVKYHQVTYEVEYGIVWEEGMGGVNLCHLMKHMIDRRRQAKDEGNGGLQEVLKLILNSIYGKTLSKNHPDRSVLIDIDIAYAYLWEHFNEILEFNMDFSREQALFKMPNSIKSRESVYPQIIGCMTLSSSKRIMNEVMGLANDLEMPIYYQDTDSIHISGNHISDLAKAFKELYGRNLIGKYIGQFHSDFDAPAGVYEVEASTSIFAGKKAYCDILTGVRKEKHIDTYPTSDEIDDVDDGVVHKPSVEVIKLDEFEKWSGQHYRLKGVTKAGMEYSIKEFDGDVISLYKQVCDKGHKFILNPEGSVSFENDGFNVKSRVVGTFTRVVKF